jgi:hypothetical protein
MFSWRTLAVVLALAGLVLLAPAGLAVAPASAAGFNDVPADFWAKGWIDSLVGDDIVKGYTDGSYKPNANVTRDQMAVFIGRVLRLLKASRHIGWVMPVEGTPGAYRVYAPVDGDATAYRLYSSVNGVDFGLVTNATYEVGFEFVQWSVPTSPTNVYFKPVGVEQVAAEEQEKQLCELLFVRSGGGPVSITITAPVGSPVPRVPIVEWTPVSNAVVYLVVVKVSGGDAGRDYWAITEGWRTSARFNQAFGPGIMFGQVLAPRDPEPLPGNVDFTVKVWGIDAGGYAFASGQDSFHTMP